MNKITQRFEKMFEGYKKPCLVTPCVRSTCSHYFLKAFFNTIFICLVLFSFSANGYGANRYWVGGGGNWSDDANHWAVSSGGAAGAGNKPGLSDMAIFDGNSGVGVCTLDEPVSVATFNMASGNTTTVDTDSSNSYTLSTSGDFIINAGTFNANDSAITVAGDWNSSGGTFNMGLSTIVIGTNGNSNTITTDPAVGFTFKNLTINAGANISVNPLDTNGFQVWGIVTISGTFTIPQDIVVAARWDNNLIINAGGELTGQGTFTRDSDNTTLHIINDGTISINTFRFRVRTGGGSQPITATTFGNNLTILNLGSLDSPAYLGCATEPACPSLVVNGTFTIYHDRVGKILTLDNSTYDIPITAGALIVGDSTMPGCGNLITGNSTTTVSGDVTINQDAAPDDCVNTINATDGTPAINVGGSWTNSDGSTAFMAGSSVVTFNGSGDQTITSGGSAFNNLTLNNPGSSFIINDNLDVNGILTLTSGNLDLITGNPDPNVNTSGDVTINTNGSVTKGTGTWTYDGTSTFMDNSSTGPQNLGTVVVD